MPLSHSSSKLGRLLGHQISRFASVGVVNTLVDFGAFLLLSLLGMPAVGANVISTSLGMAVSFVGNRRFVFDARGGKVKQLVLFLVVAGIGVWVIQPTVIVLLMRAAESGGIGTGALTLAGAKTAAIAVAAVWNFLLYKHLVFSKPGGGDRAHPLVEGN